MVTNNSQVDVRILKAVAIEHSNDVDAAAEFVVLEVLPTISSRLADCKPASQQAEHPSGRVESEEPSSLLNCHEAPAEIHQRAKFSPTVCTGEDFGGAHQQMDSSCVQLTSLDDSSSGASLHSPSDRDQTSVDSETRVVFPTNGHNTSVMVGSKQYSYSAVVSGTHKDASVADENSSSQPCIPELPCNKPDVDHFVASNGGKCENHSDTSSLEGESTIQNFPVQSIIAEEKYDLIDHVSTEGKNDCFSISECIGTISTCSSEPQLTASANPDDLPGTTDAYHDSQHATAIQSSQTTSIDYLEEFITNARSNKKTLLSAMESILDMARDVEQQEKAAEQVKEEGANDSVVTLAKVEELKQMLDHAKEMRQELEARMAAAAREIDIAERERQEKEESASKAYAEQQLIMEKVVEESKKIQQQAEENAKLREFLVDRGRVVDALQGEISVICEDVKALKERIDGRLPLSKSLSSSQGSFVLASLSSTFRKKAPGDQALEPTSSSGSLKSLNQELSNSQQTHDTRSEGEENEAASGSGREDNGDGCKLQNRDAGSLKEASDDEWLLFD
ncbi:hypothetical protein ACLOJK_025942 [Asimina triloba]